MTYMLTRPDAGIVGPRIMNADGTVQGSARRFPGLHDRDCRPELVADAPLPR